MSNQSDKLISWLFKTDAVRVCPKDKPFWYTSGAIGPYYINTHFLYGNEVKANCLLNLIDEVKTDVLACPVRILDEVRQNYKSNSVFKALMDEMVNYIKDNINLNEIDYISGGERRDWFFSLLAADMLSIPHITIYKDMRMVVSEAGKTAAINNLTDKKLLHIADLLNEASSYEKAWMPAARAAGGEIKWSIVVVDRKQGGEELLSRMGVESLSMVNIDRSLFQTAKNMSLINESQYAMISDYMDNPREAMRSFLVSHPEFIQNSLNSDSKTAERAKMCIDKNIYGLK